MSLPIYPGRDLLKGPGYSQSVTRNWFNASADTATGAHITVGLAQYPLHDFELTYDFLRDGETARGPWQIGARAALERRTLEGFFGQMAGSLGRCLYKDIDDCQVSQQPLGVGDDATTTFTLIRTFGANGYGWSEPIGQVDLTQPFAVYLNNSSVALDPSKYTLSTANPAANTLTFVTPPPLGQQVRVDMGFLFYCRLSDDTQTFEKFMDRLWKVGKVTLRSCRPGA